LSNQIVSQSTGTEDPTIEHLAITGHNNNIENITCQKLTISGHNNTVSITDCEELKVSGMNNNIYNNGEIVGGTGPSPSLSQHSHANSNSHSHAHHSQPASAAFQNIPGLNIDLNNLGSLGAEITRYVNGALQQYAISPEMAHVTQYMQEEGDGNDEPEDPSYTPDYDEEPDPEPEEDPYDYEDGNDGYEISAPAEEYESNAIYEPSGGDPADIDQEEEYVAEPSNEIQEEEEELTEEQRQEIINKIINDYPLHSYVPGSDKNETCSICLEKLRKNDVIRTLGCMHAFHQRCLDPWLQTNLICPLCRNPLISDN